MITYLENQETNWKPFEQVIQLATPEIIANSPFPQARNKTDYFLHDFMFMGTVTDSSIPGKQINIYKHCDTRRALNIDNDGKCYSFETKWLRNDIDPWEDGASESFYQPQETQAALFSALS